MIELFDQLLWREEARAGPGALGYQKASPWLVFSEQDLERRVLQAQCTGGWRRSDLSLTASSSPQHGGESQGSDWLRGLFTAHSGYSHSAFRVWVQEHPYRQVLKGSCACS